MQWTCGPVCLELVKGVPAAVVALIIGAIAAGISHRQYRVARAKLNLDLFEHRLELYLSLKNLLSERISPLHPDSLDETTDAEKAFWQNSQAMSHFLFGPEVAEFWSQTLELAATLEFVHREIAQMTPESERWDSTRAHRRELQAKAENLLSQLRPMLGPYMDFKEWRGHEPWTIRLAARWKPASTPKRRTPFDT